MNKRKLFFLSSITLLVINLFSACKDIEIPGGPLSAYDQVYMPSAISTPDTINLKMKDSIQNVAFGADFGGYAYPEQDIQVEFQIAPDLIAAFNLKKGTKYELLPEGCYTFEKKSATILKGKLSTDPLHISINPFGKLVARKGYILPVTISQIDEGVQVNEDLRTTYFLIKAL